MKQYKFFTRIQQEGEPVEKFIVVLKILASTCNFSTLRDSLVRDRIICGIRDSKLREDLLKVPDLDLDKCINACRASELSKERNKAIEATSETVHHLHSGNKRNQDGKDDKDAHRKLIRKCKFCGRQHWRGNCPAYGVECQKCYKPNHFLLFACLGSQSQYTLWKARTKILATMMKSKQPI